MRVKITGKFGAVAALGGMILVGGCTESSLRMSPDFSVASRQNAAAQIADPDAHYEGVPAPGSSGPRVGLALSRYNKNNVVPPAATSASSATIGGAGSAGASSSMGTP